MSVFDVAAKLPDPLSGDIGAALLAMRAIATWTAEKAALNEALQALLSERGYVRFRGHPSRYHLGRVGESCLYAIPAGRRGILRSFRGRTARIVCVGSGRFDWQLMAGELTPVDIRCRARHPDQDFQSGGET